MSKEYAKAGVSLNSGYEVIKRIKQDVKRTNNLGTLSSIGDFGGLFHLLPYKMKDPVLVSGTDGVGTKLLIAQHANYHLTIGQDLVAMCVNDIVAVGAKPLFFLDYIATGKIEPQVIEDIVKGICDACVIAGTALLGGETAEMPDMYQEHHYDLAGFAVGAVERELMLNKDAVNEADVLIGLPSSGIHSNGYSLVRKILFKNHHINIDEYVEELDTTWKAALLTPTKLYVKGFDFLFANKYIKAMAHITGGGFIENIPRALPDGLGVVINEASLPKLPIFALLERLGNIPKAEMFNVFNMGIGMVIIAAPENQEMIISHLEKFDYRPRVIGKVIKQLGVQIQ